MGKKQSKVVFNAKILKELLPLARPLSFFIPDPRNARTHTPANIKAIANSLKLHGQHRPAVSTPDGRLIIGHGMLEAAKSLGWTHLAVLTTNDTDREALSRAILDNRTSDLSDFDIPILKDLLVELDDGLGNLDELTGFSEKELKKLIEWEPKVQDAEPQFDKAEELRKKWGVCTGQLWELGDHRLVCGDCTDRAIVERVMGGEKTGMLLTDPPYAVDYVAKARDMNRRGYGHSRAKSRAAIEGDGLQEGQEEGLWKDSIVNALAILDEHPAIYIWHAPGRAMLRLYNLIESLDILHHATLIWVKNNFVIGRCDYQWQHEPCFYGWPRGNRPEFLGPRNQTTILTVSKEPNPLHPTQKPVELFTHLISNHKGDVYDPFLGSGTTLIACENLGRKCRAIEISPQYVSVAIQRWADATGKVPKILTETRKAQDAA